MQMTALCWDACVYKLVCSVPRGIFLSSITLNDKTDTGPRSVITDPHAASVSVFSQCLSYSYVPDLKLFSYLWSLIFSVLLFSPILLHRSLVFTHTSSASLDPSQYLFSVSLFSLGLIQKALTLPDSCTHTHRHSVAARLFQEAFPAWRVSCSVFWRHIPHLCTVTVNGRLRSRAQTTALVFTFSFSVWAEWVTRRDDWLLWTCLVLKVLNGVLLQAAMWDFFLLWKLWKFYESLSKRVDVFLFNFIHKPTRLSNLQNSEYY